MIRERVCTECGTIQRLYGAFWRGRWYCARCNVELCRKLPSE